MALVRMTSSSSLVDKRLINYSLATTRQSHVHKGGHVLGKRVVDHSLLQSLWYTMCVRV